MQSSTYFVEYKAVIHFAMYHTMQEL